MDNEMVRDIVYVVSGVRAVDGAYFELEDAILKAEPYAVDTSENIRICMLRNDVYDDGDVVITRYFVC